MQAPVGKRLRKLRLAQDWTQETLATEAGVNVITVSRLENGTAKAVYGDTVVALAKALHTTTDSLLGRREPPPRPDMLIRLPNAEGRSRPVVLVDMTDAQLDEAEQVLATLEPWQLATWLVTLARYIRETT